MELKHNGPITLEFNDLVYSKPYVAKWVKNYYIYLCPTTQKLRACQYVIMASLPVWQP